MAKLTGVTTLDMQNGAITKVEYGGAVYASVDGTSIKGDILLRVNTGIAGQVTVGEYYEGHFAKFGDAAVAYRDEEGDVMDAASNRFVVFRKVTKTTPQVSAPYAEIITAKIEAVEGRITALEAEMASESETLKVGDYVVSLAEANAEYSITNTRMVLGKIVEGRLSRGDDIRVEVVKHEFETAIGDDYSVMSKYFRKATEAEIAATTAPAKPKTGDIVVITANTNSSSNKVGDIGKIEEAPFNDARSVSVRVPGGPDTDAIYTCYDEMRLATPTEIAQYESASVFTKAGRKPNEYRKGDLGRITDTKGAYGYSEGDIVEVGRDFGGTTVVDAVYLKSGYIVCIELVCFAENRVDAKEVA